MPRLKALPSILALSFGLFFCPLMAPFSPSLSANLAAKAAQSDDDASTPPSPDAVQSDGDKTICDEDLWCLETSPFDVNLLFHMGYQRYGLAALNQTMTDKGYSAFGENMFDLGGSLQIIVWNMITEFEGMIGLSPPSFNPDYQSTLTTGNVFLNVGYQFKPIPQLRIYPLVGLGMGFLDLDFYNRNRFPTFDEYLSNPGREGQLSNLFLALNLALGIDWRWDWGFQLGLRGGWLLTPPSNWWGTSSALSNNNSNNNNNSINLTGGPEITLSGPYLKMLIGF